MSLQIKSNGYNFFILSVNAMVSFCSVVLYLSAVGDLDFEEAAVSSSSQSMYAFCSDLKSWVVSEERSS